MVMEHEERKSAKVYAIITLYTIILLVVGILLGFAVGRQSVMSEREIQQSDTLQVERVATMPLEKLVIWDGKQVICQWNRSI